MRRNFTINFYDLCAKRPVFDEERGSGTKDDDHEVDLQLTMTKVMLMPVTTATTPKTAAMTSAMTTSFCERSSVTGGRLAEGKGEDRTGGGEDGTDAMVVKTETFRLVE